MNKGLVLKESLKSAKLKGSIIYYDIKTSKDVNNRDFPYKFKSSKIGILLLKSLMIMNGRYIISVPRIKESQLKNKSSSRIRTDVLPITKEIYDLIQEYKSLADYTQDKYLLSYNLYYSKTPKNAQASVASSKYNKDVFCTNNYTS